MKRLRLVMLTLVTLAVPAAALADNGAPPSPSDLATQACKQLQTGSASTFASRWGTKANAFGKCVSAGTKTADNELSAANATCKTEQADANFANSHGGKTFQQVYGTNTQSHGKGSGANAFGKCVSQHARQSSQAQTNATLGAGKQCKAMTMAALAQAGYGSKPNAFGKCVAAKSKLKQG